MTRNVALQIGGVVLIALPHIFGAPHPHEYVSTAPAELAGHFVATSLAVTAIFWGVLGFASGAVYERLRAAGMRSGLVLVLGGARSGKSRFAEKLVAESGLEPVYIATAEPGDAEMAERIAHHRAYRGPAWRTVEAPLALEDALAAEAGAGRAVLVDCLTLWLSNLMQAGADFEARGAALCDVAQRLPGPARLRLQRGRSRPRPRNAARPPLSRRAGPAQPGRGRGRRPRGVHRRRPAARLERIAMTGLSRIPATIVTGFLGAGKTTLIRHLLQNAGGRKIALIVNEFGDVGFDGQVLADCGSEACGKDDIIELSNGCICCTVADDFLPAMEKILGRAAPPDHIVIETSGLALPQPLVKAFAWPSVKSRVTVDGVVTVVDAAAVAEGRVASDEAKLAEQRAKDLSLEHDDPVEELFEDQLRCADLILISKADLVDEAGLARVEAAIAEDRRPAARTIRVANGAIPADILLGQSAQAEADSGNRKSHHELAGEEHEHDDFETFVVELAAADRRRRWSRASRRRWRSTACCASRGSCRSTASPRRSPCRQSGRAWRRGSCRTPRAGQGWW